MIFVVNFIFFILASILLSYWFLNNQATRNLMASSYSPVLAILLILGSILIIVLRVNGDSDHLLKLPSFLASAGFSLLIARVWKNNSMTFAALPDTKKAFISLGLSVFNVLIMPFQGMLIYALFFYVDEGQSPDIESMQTGVVLTNIMYVVTWLLAIFFIVKANLTKYSKTTILVTTFSGVLLVISAAAFGGILLSDLLELTSKVK